MSEQLLQSGRIHAFSLWKMVSKFRLLAGWPAGRPMGADGGRSRTCRMFRSSGELCARFRKTRSLNRGKRSDSFGFPGLVTRNAHRSTLVDENMKPCMMIQMESESSSATQIGRTDRKSWSYFFFISIPGQHSQCASAAETNV